MLLFGCTAASLLALEIKIFQELSVDVIKNFKDKFWYIIMYTESLRSSSMRQRKHYQEPID